MAASEDSPVVDGAEMVLNRGGDVVAGEQVETPTLPERPSDGADKARWVDYVVALGADRDAVTGTTSHWSPDGVTVIEGEYGPVEERGGYVDEPGLTRSDLIDLADRLGG